jgi:hypothetical protein
VLLWLLWLLFAPFQIQSVPTLFHNDLHWRNFSHTFHTVTGCKRRIRTSVDGPFSSSPKAMTVTASRRLFSYFSEQGALCPSANQNAVSFTYGNCNTGTGTTSTSIGRDRANARMQRYTPKHDDRRRTACRVPRDDELRTFVVGRVVGTTKRSHSTAQRIQNLRYILPFVIVKITVVVVHSPKTIIKDSYHHHHGDGKA